MLRPPGRPQPECARGRVLVADDEPEARGALSSLLGAAGYEVATAARVDEAIDMVEDFAPHLVLADVALPDCGPPLVAALSAGGQPPAALLLLARRELVPAAIRGLAAGADGYLLKPVEEDRLRLLAERLIDEHLLRARVHSMRERLAGHPALRGLVGESALMQAVREGLAQAAASRAPVLLSGERGTGKLLAAELLHECRSGGPFVPLSCAGLSGEELEDGLDRAHRGTLFLDEVVDLPPAAQASLADFLARGQDAGPARARHRRDVRIAAATRHHLTAGALEFSDELLGLLAGVALVMPPLRHRRSDVPLLVDHFLRQAGSEASAGAVEHRPAQSRRAAVDAALARLADHSWPGNVAELKSLISSRR